MRHLTLPLLFLLAAPAPAVAQEIAARAKESAAIQALSDTRRLILLPNETVGFRVLGAAEEARTLRVTTGHLRSGRLYHTVARVVPRDGSSPRLVEGTVSAEAPTISLGLLPAGEYVVSVHLEDFASGVVRDARNKVVLQ